MYVQQMLTTPLWMAIFPIYTRIFEEEGNAATARFLHACLKYYFLLAVPLFAGMWGFSQEIILFLAGSKYAAAAAVVPFVLCATFVHGTYHIVSAGLYLKNRTNVIGILTLVAAANLALNVYFIPRYGIIGAAYSTLIAHILLIIGITGSSHPLLAIPWPTLAIFTYLLVASAVLLSAVLTTNAGVTVLIITLIISSLAYLSINILLDLELRKFFHEFISLLLIIK